LVRLGLNFHTMGEQGGGWASDTFFCHGQKRHYLSRTSSQQRARGATKEPVDWLIDWSCNSIEATLALMQLK